MTGDWAHQARWWAGEMRRRALVRAAQRLSLESRALVLHSFELTDYPNAIVFDGPSPHRSSCLVARHVVSAPVRAVVPGGRWRNDEEHRWNEISVYRVRDVVVDARSGLVFHRGRVLASSGTGWRPARESAFLSGATARVEREPAAPVLGGPIAPLGSPSNYFHFLTETLPQLLAILHVQPDAVALFGEPLPGFVIEILDLLGLRYEVVTEGPPIHSDEVWLCDSPPAEWPHPDLIVRLRDAVFARVGQAAGDYPEQVYISRAGSERSLEDEAMLEDDLAAQGFSILHLETMPFPEQVQHLRAARLVVAPHGAGQANMVFMDAGTRVVELTTGEWWQPCFRNLAGIRGVGHELVVLPAGPEYAHGRASDAVPLLRLALELTQ
jgi:hypothetical protein